MNELICCVIIEFEIGERVRERRRRKKKRRWMVLPSTSSSPA